MAIYQFPAPAPMDLKGHVMENWKNSESAWQFYCIASELDQKLPSPADKTQMAVTLCTVMGMDCTTEPGFAGDIGAIQM